MLAELNSLHVSICRGLTNLSISTDSSRGLFGIPKAKIAVGCVVFLLAGAMAYFLLNWLEVPGLNAQIARLEAEVDRLSGEVNRLSAENDRFEALNDQLNTTVTDLKVINADLNDTATRLEIVNEELSEKESTVQRSYPGFDCSKSILRDSEFGTKYYCD